MSDDNVQKFLDRVQALIDKAHSTTFEEEAKACLAKADELMLKYSLDPVMVLDPDRKNYARPVFDSKPERRTITILKDGDEMDLHMMQALSSLFWYCAQHLFVRVAKRTYREAVVFGYDVDINFLEMYFLKLKLHMFSNMLTTVDSSKPWVEVLVGLKNMGYKWEDIHYKLQDHENYPHRGLRWERRFGVQFTAKVKEYTEVHGLPRNKSSNPRAWREDFIDGYVYMVAERLRQMRAETVLDNPLLPDLIADKKSKVEEAFWDEFPEFRPHPPECQCDPCHVGKCRDHSCTRPVCKARRAPVRTSNVRYRNVNHDATAAGRRVGATADLTDKGSIG